MSKQLFYEDVGVGTEVTPLVKHPTTQQLVKWAGASEDFYQIHYDKDFAQANGLPGVIVHGRLKAAFLGQLVVDWIGEQGVLKELSCTYRAMDVPGEDLTCKGKVTKKYVENDEHCVACEIWVENAKGEKTTQGMAVARLPSKG
ncbi:MaoC/PaaZ C-terminal domain-containing protein [Chloroflexota bacterium]